MYNKGHKQDQRSQALRRIIEPGQASLVTTILIIISALPLMPCLGQTSVSETAAPDTAENDLLQILSQKDAEIERADGQYAQEIDAAEKNYEQSLLKARTVWSEKVADARETEALAEALYWQKLHIAVTWHQASSC